MSVYHLHIPRTSGGFIRRSILSEFDGYSVAGHYRTISNNEFQKASFISGHYGLNPCSFVDKTFTVLRDPNELTFSYIKYLLLGSGYSYVKEDLLKKYLYEEKKRVSVTNVITKFLSSNIDIDKYNKNIDNHLNMAYNLWYLDVKRVSVEAAMEQIESKNISVFFYGSNRLYEDISAFFNIKLKSFLGARINQSFQDTSGLYEKYFEEISLANSVDLELYRRIKSENNAQV